MFTVKVFKLELNHHECLPSFQKPFLFGFLFYCVAFIVTVTCCNYPRSRSNEELDKHIISTKSCHYCEIIEILLSQFNVSLHVTSSMTSIRKLLPYLAEYWTWTSTRKRYWAHNLSGDYNIKDTAIKSIFNNILWAQFSYESIWKWWRFQTRLADIYLC